MISSLFLSLPFIAVALMYGFKDVQWSKKNAQHTFIPFSLGSFLLYSYVALSSLLTGTHLYFSYLAVAYIFLTWAVGFYLDLSQLKKQQKKTKQMMNQTGIICCYVVLLVFFSYLLSMGNIKAFSINTACFMLFPLSSYMANKVSLRLTIYYLLLLIISCFFMAIPTFIDILYVTTIFYIIIVLEVEGQAVYGINGSLILGASLALWTVTVPETSGQLLFLLLACISIVLFFFWPVLQGAYCQWAKRIGTTE
ncbi:MULTISPECIES: hypothetical protein [Shouchella]|uniref:Uncharacterized protein n=3 Tax=Bacillaceae TaxID=186817 RepID=A0A060LUT0_9BACI|nr:MULTISPECIES: hypothetical protein [Shouchella]AIC95011.1 hypothetical protein BleG1_2435 [Shouchella lehensis G1]MBG9784148.1 hypothetical protein [Shouchella lehensis]RQW20842.1 hypothetical protein EH196_12220 [Bacillus sp. C1-1]TES50866.1 hypothetical protein E2L03_02735 [Shouchella lehensis]